VEDKGRGPKLAFGMLTEDLLAHIARAARPAFFLRQRTGPWSPVLKLAIECADHLSFTE
jgi:hypothetical protein